MSRIVSSTAEASVTRAPDHVRWNQLYLGLAFTTLATLVLELALTRIFSVVFYYHFAFLAISIALFGMGSGGVFSYFISHLVTARRGNLYSKLGWLALADAAFVILALRIVLSASADPGFFTLASVYIASALPFFFAGAVVSLVISEAIDRVDRAYFFDLAGAAAGCLVLIPFLNTFGGPNTVISASVFYSIAAAIWFHQAGETQRRAPAVFVALALVLLMIANGRLHILDVSIAKGEKLPPEKFTAWNSFSRVGVTNNRGYLSVVIDGDAATAIAPLDWNRLTDEQRAILTHEGPGFPYFLRPGAKALVIGAGGGYDVARAFASGSRDITAVEINPIIATQIMRKRFVKESHGLYFRPEVRVFVEDGRSFVRRSPEKYQVIQATLVDTWASTAAGAFALSENSLYTTDAFYDYLSHLTDDGVVTFTRWGFDPPRESLRLVTLAMDALAKLGQTNPAQHVMVVRDDTAKLQGWGAQDTVVISRKPFTTEDVLNARQWLASGKLEGVYLPGAPTNTAFAQLLSSPSPSAFWKTYPFDISPVDDDRPFFFYTVQPRDIARYLTTANTQSADFKINRALPLLATLVAVSLAATLVILLLPYLIPGTHIPKQKGIFLFLLYFLFLGAGYILIQVALIQKFVLLLGHPTYALTVIVLSMLVFSGLGSFVSKPTIAGDDSRLISILLGISILVAALAFAAPSIVGTAAAWPLASKMLITAAAVAPVAFFMGMPFPSGLRRLEERHSPSVRWAWSLNSAASVLGSGGAIVLAIYFGLRATLLIGAAFYLSALFVILLTRKSAPWTI